MDIVIDTSALLAVILAEPERDRIVRLTSGHTLIGPGSIPWEIGNAFSAMLKQRRLGLTETQQGLKIFDAIPLRFVRVDRKMPFPLPIKPRPTLTTRTSWIAQFATQPPC